MKYKNAHPGSRYSALLKKETPFNEGVLILILIKIY